MLKTDERPNHIIPFNLPTKHSAELNYLIEAANSHHRHGSGQFTARAVKKIQQISGANNVLLTHSGTGALELATLLINLKPNEEVILPSFTFSSTANAVVLRGAVPVFADIDPTTQCLDPNAVKQLITQQTRAIMPVHYAGVACDMDALCSIANQHGLVMIEDAAQAIGASLHNKGLGTIAALGALSFHDSKNISSGEGGALLINDNTYVKRAEILWEKGTNRSQFLRGEVDKYTWADLGSSFLPSELTSAFLLGQLEHTEQINQARKQRWDIYQTAFATLEIAGLCKRPFIPKDSIHNGHIYYLILPSPELRNQLLAYLKSQGILATFHYVPLHNSPAGQQFGKTPLPMPNTDRAGNCLIRLPLFPSLTTEQQAYVIEATNAFFTSR